MTSHEFDERLSAYLDGTLSASEKAQVEEELRRNPELRAALERLRKLDQLARQAQVEMPAEGYFDGLAGRIDARLAREAQPKRRFALLQPVLPKGRLIAILSSVAAVFVVVVVVYQAWKPTTEEYRTPRSIIVNPPEQRSTEQRLEAQPAIATEPLTAKDQERKQEIPDTVVGKVIESDQMPVGVQDEEYKELPVFPEPKKTDRTMAMPETVKRGAGTSPLDTLRQQVQPRERNAMMIVRTLDSSANKTVGKSIVSKPTSALAEGPMTPVQSAPEAQSIEGVSIATQPELPAAGASIPLAIDSVEITIPKMELHKGKFAETFDAAAYEQRVQAMLDSGKYVPVYFTAWDPGARDESMSRFDVENATCQNWYDSLSIMGLDQWQAENAYREARRSSGNRLAEYITARLYIQHYLSSGSARDVDLWRERLEEIRRWERDVGK